MQIERIAAEPGQRQPRGSEVVRWREQTNPTTLPPHHIDALRHPSQGQR